jgi:hypothetical protein
MHTACIRGPRLLGEPSSMSTSRSSGPACLRSCQKQPSTAVQQHLVLRYPHRTLPSAVAAPGVICGTCLRGILGLNSDDPVGTDVYLPHNSWLLVSKRHFPIAFRVPTARPRMGKPCFDPKATPALASSDISRAFDLLLSTSAPSVDHA